MAKSQRKSNKEVRKPKAEKVKTIAANASTKDRPVAVVTVTARVVEEAATASGR